LHDGKAGRPGGPECLIRRPESSARISEARSEFNGGGQAGPALLVWVAGGALSLLGKMDEKLRLPMVPVSEPTRVAVRSAMVHAGLIN